MMKKNLLPLLLLIFSGCATQVGDFSIISTKTIDMDGEYELVGRDVKGTDMRPIILYFPSGTPTIEGAINNALVSVDGDIMTDATVTFNLWWLVYYGEQRYIVVGDVWKEVN